MVRQKARKSIEELYTTKFEGNQAKTHVSSNNNTTNNSVKNARANNDFGYIITSNTPYNANFNASNQGASNNLQTSRRKPLTARGKSDCTYRKETDKVISAEITKKECVGKQKTSRTDRTNHGAYEKQSCANFAKDVHQPQHHHQHHHTSVDDDKDDDTEEFFELIRQTVENAIGKSISDTLNRNFRELTTKIDRFTTELKSTNTILTRLQTEISNKVIHYGEENSRHFRYLCMKSEYDKMFYQHHTMLAASSAPEKNVKEPKVNEYPTTKKPCVCQDTKLASTETHKSSSEEPSMSNKSSEMGMREVLEQIQRFCTQMQLNEVKSEDHITKNTYNIDEAVKHVPYEDDDDDFPISSDGMTPRSEDNMPCKSKYASSGHQTTRGSNNGGGDA